MKKIKARHIKKGSEIRDPSQSRGYRLVENVHLGTAELWLPHNGVAVALSNVADWVIFHVNQDIHTRKPKAATNSPQLPSDKKANEPTTD